MRGNALIEIINQYYSSDNELIKIISDIRTFESRTRNIVAHEIKPLNDDDKKNCKTIFDKIMKLTINAKLIKRDQVNIFLKAYDSMNEFLLSKETLV